MKSLYFLIALVLLVSTATFGCSSSSDKAAAENITASYFEAIRNKDFDAAISFYSPKYFELVSKDDWLQVLKAVNEKLGDLETYELTSYEFGKVVGTIENGTSCKLQYEVIYSKYPAIETLTLFRSATGGEYNIVGHKINSIGLAFE